MTTRKMTDPRKRLYYLAGRFDKYSDEEYQRGDDIEVNGETRTVTYTRTSMYTQGYELFLDGTENQADGDKLSIEKSVDHDGDGFEYDVELVTATQTTALGVSDVTAAIDTITIDDETLEIGSDGQKDLILATGNNDDNDGDATTGDQDLCPGSENGEPYDPTDEFEETLISVPGFERQETTQPGDGEFYAWKAQYTNAMDWTNAVINHDDYYVEVQVYEGTNDAWEVHIAYSDDANNGDRLKKATFPNHYEDPKERALQEARDWMEDNAPVDANTSSTDEWSDGQRSLDGTRKDGQQSFDAPPQADETSYEGMGEVNDGGIMEDTRNEQDAIESRETEQGQLSRNPDVIRDPGTAGLDDFANNGDETADAPNENEDIPVECTECGSEQTVTPVGDNGLDGIMTCVHCTADYEMQDARDQYLNDSDDSDDSNNKYDELRETYQEGMVFRNAGGSPDFDDDRELLITGPVSSYYYDSTYVVEMVPLHKRTGEPLSSYLTDSDHLDRVTGQVVDEAELVDYTFLEDMELVRENGPQAPFGTGDSGENVDEWAEQEAERVHAEQDAFYDAMGWTPNSDGSPIAPDAAEHSARDNQQADAPDEDAQRELETHATGDRGSSIADVPDDTADAEAVLDRMGDAPSSFNDADAAAEWHEENVVGDEGYNDPDPTPDLNTTTDNSDDPDVHEGTMVVDETGSVRVHGDVPKHVEDEGVASGRSFLADDVDDLKDFYRSSETGGPVTLGTITIPENASEYDYEYDWTRGNDALNHYLEQQTTDADDADNTSPDTHNEAMPATVGRWQKSPEETPTNDIRYEATVEDNDDRKAVLFAQVEARDEWSIVFEAHERRNAEWEYLDFDAPDSDATGMTPEMGSRAWSTEQINNAVEAVLSNVTPVEAFNQVAGGERPSIEFPSMDAATAARDEFADHICSADDKRYKTVQFALDTPDDVIEAANDMVAANLEADARDTFVQVELSDEEWNAVKDQAMKHNSSSAYVHAKTSKGYITAAGGNFRSQYDATIEPGEHAGEMDSKKEQAANPDSNHTGPTSKNLDEDTADVDDDTIADAKAKADSGMCKHAMDYLEDNPDAPDIDGVINDLTADCGYTAEELDGIIEDIRDSGDDPEDVFAAADDFDTATEADATGDEEPAFPIDNTDADVDTGSTTATGDELPDSALEALGKAWGKYKSTRSAMHGSRRDLEAHARTINSIRMTHGQAPMSFDHLPVFDAGNTEHGTTPTPDDAEDSTQTTFSDCCNGGAYDPLEEF